MKLSFLFQQYLCMTTGMNTNPPNAASSRVRVLVIGAGFSGLSVAYHLRDSKKIQVQVVEARPRVGGRVFPYKIHKHTVVDLGGQWVHEASPKNPIRQLLQELEIHFQKEGCLQKQKNVLFDEHGNQLSVGTVKAASKFFYKALDNYRQEDVDLDTSFQDLLNQASPSSLQSDEFQRVLNYKAHQTACYEGGRLQELSVHLADALYQNLGGPDEYIEGGYNLVLDKLVDKIGKDKIRLGCIVESIAYNVDNGVTITVKSSGKEEQIYGDYCVCTVPLGVLQKRAIDFVPPLPPTRWAAIDSIGMGLLNKIVLQFEHSCWPGDFERFGVAHLDPTRVKSFYDCSSEVGAPVLTCFLGGDAARRVDSLSGLDDNEAVEDTMAALRSIFGKESVPDPIASAVTRWHTDPFAFGAYSFAKVGCTENAYDEVASPIGPLLFAGEHTSQTSHSTVHGAWETGHREAKRIMNLVAQSNKIASR
jgi:monoamine oxidase